MLEGLHIETLWSYIENLLLQKVIIILQISTQQTMDLL